MNAFDLCLSYLDLHIVTDIAVCVCVCVWLRVSEWERKRENEREREREREKERERGVIVRNIWFKILFFMLVLCSNSFFFPPVRILSFSPSFSLSLSLSPPTLSYPHSPPLGFLLLHFFLLFPLSGFLENKLALITGSTSGIGLGIAEGLAARGCHVILNGTRSEEQVKDVKEYIAK